MNVIEEEIRARELAAEEKLKSGKTESGLIIRWMSDIEEEQPRWLWRFWIPAAAVTVIGGKGGDGKGLFVAHIVACLTRGRPMPDGSTVEGGLKKVLIITREDDPATALKPRLRIADADMSRVACSHGEIQIGKDGGSAADAAHSMAAVAVWIEEVIRREGIDLVIIDPLGAWIEDDANSSANIRAVIDPLTAVARRTGAAIVVVAHLRKGGADDLADAFAGSRAVIDSVRCAIHLGRSGVADRVVSVVKTNGRPPDGPLAFALARSPNAQSVDDPPMCWFRVASESDMAAVRSRAKGGGRWVVTVAQSVEHLASDHRPLDDVTRALRRSLEPTMPGVTLQACRDGIQAAIDAGQAHEGRDSRGRRTVGLMPAEAPETATDRAVSAWMSNPSGTVRDIAKQAECSTTQAYRARSIAFPVSVPPSANGAGNNGTNHGTPHADSVPSPPARSIGARGEEGTEQRHLSRGERLTADPSPTEDAFTTNGVRVDQ